MKVWTPLLTATRGVNWAVRGQRQMVRHRASKLFEPTRPVEVARLLPRAWQMIVGRRRGGEHN